MKTKRQETLGLIRILGFPMRIIFWKSWIRNETHSSVSKSLKSEYCPSLTPAKKFSIIMRFPSEIQSENYSTSFKHLPVHPLGHEILASLEQMIPRQCFCRADSSPRAYISEIVSSLLSKHGQLRPEGSHSFGEVRLLRLPGSCFSLAER